MADRSNLHKLAPHIAPAVSDARAILFTLRRMAAYGLRDAFAAHAMIGAFGLNFRCPLALLRALLADMAATATGAITVAPCCYPRMTTDERNILGAIAAAGERPDDAARLLADTLGADCNERVCAIARALGDCLTDMGRPLRI